MNSIFGWCAYVSQLLYSRLSSCKEEGRKHARQKFRHLVANPIAVELGMDDPQGPSSVQEQILRDRGAEDNEESLYQYMLEACEKLFMNELDQATFEENMRWFFGTKVGGFPPDSSGHLRRLAPGIPTVHCGQNCRFVDQAGTFFNGLLWSDV
jgi:C-terminal domain of Sin3a protein